MKRMFLKLIVAILLVFIIETIYYYPISYAKTTLSDIISAGDDFVKIAEGKDPVIDQGALKDTSDTIYNILFTIGVVFALAVGMIIGIQFIIGSVDEKAKIKETFVPYVVGVFIIFGGFGIWKLAINIGNDVVNPASNLGNVGGMDTQHNEYEKGENNARIFAENANDWAEIDARITEIVSSITSDDFEAQGYYNYLSGYLSGKKDVDKFTDEEYSEQDVEDEINKITGTDGYSEGKKKRLNEIKFNK